MPLCLELTGKVTEGLQCAGGFCSGSQVCFVVGRLAVEFKVVQALMWLLTQTEFQPHHSLSLNNRSALSTLNHEQELSWQTFQVYLTPEPSF